MRRCERARSIHGRMEPFCRRFVRFTLLLSLWSGERVGSDRRSTSRDGRRTNGRSRHWVKEMRHLRLEMTRSRRWSKRVGTGRAEMSTVERVQRWPCIGADRIRRFEITTGVRRGPGRTIVQITWTGTIFIGRHLEAVLLFIRCWRTLRFALLPSMFRLWVHRWRRRERRVRRVADRQAGTWVVEHGTDCVRVMVRDVSALVARLPG